MMDLIFKYLCTSGFLVAALQVFMTEAKEPLPFIYLFGFTGLLIYFSRKVQMQEIREAKEYIDGLHDKEYPRSREGQIDLLIKKQKASIILEEKLLEDLKLTPSQYYKLKILREEQIADLKLLKIYQISEELYLKNLKVRQEKMNEILKGV